jgi:nucleoside-diphosphate-sugar epimerase
MNTNPTTWLITGAAGFIGMHTSLRLLERDDKVIGLDNLNDYYDVFLKQARLAKLQPHASFTFTRLMWLTAMAWQPCLLTKSLGALSVWRRRAGDREHP